MSYYDLYDHDYSSEDEFFGCGVTGLQLLMYEKDREIADVEASRDSLYGKLMAADLPLGSCKPRHPTVFGVRGRGAESRVAQSKKQRRMRFGF